MSWNPLLSAEIQVGKPIKQDLMQKVKDNFEYLYGKALYDAGILNGSFEIDADNDGNPDNWTKGLFGGGQGMYEDSIPAHGRRSFKFVHPGGTNNGGGYLESDYYEVAEVRTYLIGFILWSTAAGMKNLVHVKYYDKDKNYIGTDPDTLYVAANAGNELVYRSTTNPTSPKFIVRSFIPPATGRYIKIKLIGGYTDTDVAGTTFFDNVAMIPLPNAITTGTIAEGSTSLGTFQNLGNVNIEVPLITSGILQIDFFAEMKTTAGDEGTFRFTVDDSISNEYTTSILGYGTLIPFRILVPYTAISGGQINMIMWAKDNSAPNGLVYIKKAIQNISVSVIPF